MKRKIATLGETDITVHPAAGILLLLGLLTRWRALLICTYASIILHETAHAAVSALWHHPPQEVEITPLGAMMRLEDEERLPLTARISVILAGPLMTLILCALSLWLTQNGVIPRETGRLIFLSNAGILLVNLLPALPLDGGRLLSAVLLRLLRRETCWRVMRIIGTAAGALLVVGGVVGAVRRWQGSWSLAAAVARQCLRSLGQMPARWRPASHPAACCRPPAGSRWRFSPTYRPCCCLWRWAQCPATARTARASAPRTAGACLH